MKKDENYNLTGITTKFITDNLTSFQNESIAIKFSIAQTIDNRGDSSKEDVFIKLSEDFNLTVDRIKHIYYNVKK